jgi:hypothetical protein
LRVPQRLGDPLEDAFNVRKHLVVPEAQDSIAVRFEKCGALCVALALKCVLPTVELKNQLCFWTAEVHDERSDRMLAPELRPAHLPITQPPPELDLDVSLITPKAPGVWSRRFSNLAPHPTLSPEGRG